MYRVNSKSNPPCFWYAEANAAIFNGSFQYFLNVWDNIQALVEVLDKQTIDFMLHLSCNFLGRGLSYIDVRHGLLVFDMIRHGSRSCL